MKITKAVIPAAGYGTRFLPVTKSLAKEMLPIIDRPTIEYIVREILDSDITDILIIVSSNKNSIIDYFDSNFELEYQLKQKNKLSDLEMICELPRMVKIHFIRQHEQLGLGHAVLCAKSFAGGQPFALLLGDDVYVGNKKPALRQLMEAYEEVESSILGTLYVDDDQVHKYGICDPVNNDSRLVKLKSVIEKPQKKDAPSNLAIGGRYILSPTIFKYLENQIKGAGNEIQLTDSILRMMGEEDVYSYEIDGKRYDIGSKLGFLEATIDFALKRDDLKEDITNLLNRKTKEINKK